MQPYSRFQTTRAKFQTHGAHIQNPRLPRDTNPSINLVHANEHTWRNHMTFGGYSRAAEPRRQTGNGPRCCPDLPPSGHLTDPAEDNSDNGGIPAACPDHSSRPARSLRSSSSRQKDDHGGTP